MEAVSKTQLKARLAQAQALQRVEANPLTDAEMAQFKTWIDEGLTGEEMRVRILAETFSDEGPAVAAE